MRRRAKMGDRWQSRTVAKVGVAHHDYRHMSPLRREVTMQVD